MGSDGLIYVPNFIKIATDFEGILRFCISNLKGCNVGFTVGNDL
jgi:hypothetical protein